MIESRKAFLELGVFWVLAAAAVFFGAVHSWSSMFLCFSLFFLSLLYSDSALNQWIGPKVPMIFLGFLVLWVFVQILFFSEDRHETFSEVVRWAAYFCAILIIQTFRRSSLVRLMRNIVWIAIAISLYAVVLALIDQEMVLWRQKVDHLDFWTGTYFNRNHFAGLLEMAIGCQVAFFCMSFLTGKKIGSLLELGLLAFLFYVLLKTGSRMAMASIVISLGFMLIVGWRHLRSLALFLFCFLSAFFLFCLPVLWRRFTTEDASATFWDRGRFMAWEGGIDLFQDHLFGIGLGNFRWVYPAYQNEKLQAAWHYMHNDYLQLLIELGLPGFILWLSFIGSCIFLILGRIRKFHSEYSVYAWGAMVGFLSLGLHGITDFNGSVPANVLICFILLAISWILSKSQRSLEL